MTAQAFREYLREMQRLHPVAKRERVQQIRAGVDVSADFHRGRMVSLGELIEDGVNVSQVMDDRREARR